VLKEAWKSLQLKQNDDRIKEKSKQQSYRISDLQWVKLIISESWVTSMKEKKKQLECLQIVMLSASPCIHITVRTA